MKVTSSAARVLQRILNARQFGLKMIANVSYGYTSASFSGRMPFSELADSIVQALPPPHTHACARVLPDVCWP